MSNSAARSQEVPGPVAGLSPRQETGAHVITLDTAGFWIIVIMPLHNKTGTPIGAYELVQEVGPRSAVISALVADTLCMSDPVWEPTFFVGTGEEAISIFFHACLAGKLF